MQRRWLSHLYKRHEARQIGNIYKKNYVILNNRIYTLAMVLRLNEQDKLFVS